MEQKKNNNIGAIWVKSGQYGDYLSISLEINGEKKSFVAYSNKYKEQGDNKPSWNIPAPKEKSAEQMVSKFEQQQSYVVTSKNASASYNQPSTTTEDDLPF